MGSGSLRRQRHRRLQHRRRRLGLAHPARGNGPARGRQLVGRRDARRHRARAQGQAQSHPLLPFDELHLPPHGGEVRRRLDGIQFLRAVADRGVAAQDRQALRPGDRGQGGGGDRQVSSARRRRDRQVQAAPRRQDGDALRRRPAAAPRDQRLRRPRHGDRRHRLRIRPQRRLPAHRPLREEGHADLRRRDRLRTRKVRREGPPRSRRLRRQGEVPGAEDGHSIPSDAFVGLFGPLPRLRRLRDFRSRHGSGDQQSRLGPVRRPMAEAGVLGRRRR